MSDREPDADRDGAHTNARDAADGAVRRATVRTTHADAALVAAALVPDNTTEMRTTVDGDRVETVVERETTGGLRTTTDDYVTNLQVAEQLTTTEDTNHE